VNNRRAVATALAALLPLSGVVFGQEAAGADTNFIRFRGTLHADNCVFGGDSVAETADTFRIPGVSRPRVLGRAHSVPALKRPDGITPALA
jgi:hypothetical protein